MRRGIVCALIVGWVMFLCGAVHAQIITVDVINSPVEESLSKARDVYTGAATQTVRGAVQATQVYSEAQVMMMYLIIKQNDKIISLLQEQAGKPKKK
jgi:predicted DCC family thiol-disulfide oxidoreductase YuxK